MINLNEIKIMLLFWDIHCTSTIIDDLVSSMTEHVENHPKEKSILFLGDYVYHFSYDRKALLKLFRFFVDLTKLGKEVYVLAWNHDWISNHFVFSEWALLLEAFDGWVWTWNLEFITSPIIKEIDGEAVLLFPYTVIPSWKYDLEQWWPFQYLLESENANEQRSWRANILLKSMIDDRKSKNNNTKKELLVAHHRYINKTVFPGQFAQFSYRSPALSEQFLDEPWIIMISWHLHQPFSYKNYCCCGSLWSTSPLETNQIKYQFLLTRDDTGQLQMEATEIHQNPYFSIEFDGNQLKKWQIESSVKAIRTDAEEQMNAGIIPISIVHKVINFSRSTIYILSEETVTGSSLDEYCDQELLTSMHDIKIKTKRRAMGELLEELQDASLSLDTSIADRKVLLRRFLISRYGEKEANKYEELLQTLQIV